MVLNEGIKKSKYLNGQNNEKDYNYGVYQGVVSCQVPFVGIKQNI